jgi:hypothetical protein
MMAASAGGSPSASTVMNSERPLTTSWAKRASVGSIDRFSNTSTTASSVGWSITSSLNRWPTGSAASTPARRVTRTRTSLAHSPGELAKTVRPTALPVALSALSPSSSRPLAASRST